MAKKYYVCGLQKRLMETEVTTENKNKGLYWVITLVSAAACAGLLIFSPEWFWLTLPFLFTYFVKAIDMM
jgi:hypothetical protein